MQFAQGITHTSTTTVPPSSSVKRSWLLPPQSFALKFVAVFCAESDRPTKKIRANSGFFIIAEYYSLINLRVLVCRSEITFNRYKPGVRSLVSRSMAGTEESDSLFTRL